LSGERVWRVKMRNREKGSEKEEQRKSLLYPVLGWAGERGGRVKNEEQREGLLSPVPRLAGERCGRMKKRKRERCYFIWFPDWLVRAVGE
jgi:hypothetical protein